MDTPGHLIGTVQAAITVLRIAGRYGQPLLTDYSTRDRDDACLRHRVPTLT